MERIVYQKTLDTHKNGIQFTLQGFETADNLARRIEISLMASGDAIDLPLEQIMAIMYVTTPGATEPSVNECVIKDNTIVYDVLPITEEGITEMQLKIIETSLEGAKRVLASPKFAIEVIESNADDENAEQTTTFTALENAVAKAKSVYDQRLLRIEVTSNCIFKAYYADGTVYETDSIYQQIIRTGAVALARSYAKGGTGVREGEDTDNAMYYSNVSKSGAIESQENKDVSQEILNEVRLHGVYTAFTINFDTGEVEYISPRYNFTINKENGDIEVTGESISFEDEVGLIAKDWLEKLNISTVPDDEKRVAYANEAGSSTKVGGKLTIKLNGAAKVSFDGSSNPSLDITPASIGLGNVNNTSDANKPVSTAQATAIADAKKAGTDAQSNLNSHTSNKSNPHGVNCSQLGAAAANHSHTPASIGAAPAYSYGTTDLTAGSSNLETGKLHFVYE